MVGTSATDPGRVFQTGTVRVKKLYLKQFGLQEICWNLKQWFDLVLTGPGARDCSDAMF